MELGNSNLIKPYTRFMGEMNRGDFVFCILIWVNQKLLLGVTNFVPLSSFLDVY